MLRMLWLLRMLLATALGGAAAKAALMAVQLGLAPNAQALYRGEMMAQRGIAIGAVSWGPSQASDFATGAELFDKEWTFGAPMMRTACLAQVLIRHDSLDAALGKHLDMAVEELLSDKARAFTKMQWGSDPLVTDDTRHDHAAFLGYTGFALGLASRVHPDRWEQVRRGIVAKLRTRVMQRDAGRLETYPGESYPPDIAAVAGALALAAQDTHEPDPALARVLEWLRSDLDPESGLLRQAVDPATGAARDVARGSGSFLAVYFLTPADAKFAESLYRNAKSLQGSSLGFLAMRETPPNTEVRRDVDSGPILLGFGVSASGFALAGAKVFADEPVFAGLSKTAYLFGVPYSVPNGVRHIAGGPLGDAILCAMSTALSAQEHATLRRSNP